MPAQFPGVTRVLVTRPARDAGRWAGLIRQGGFEAEVLPLIDIRPASAHADVAALLQARQALGGYDAVMFVSANAVDFFFGADEAAAQYPRAQSAINSVALPRRTRFLAPGPGTAQALLAAGVPVDQVDAPPADARQFDSQALWQTIGGRAWQGSRVLLVRGHGHSVPGQAEGRDWLMRQWQACGATVEVLSVYERRTPQLDAAQRALATAAQGDGSVWLFSSSEAVANLLVQPACAGADWRRARAVASHPRIAETVSAAGWGVVVASRPALEDILNTLRSIESPTHE
ncbi:MAG: uroporphyrinogen-III synthase [Polaromonas sp.]|nr:uroporphyrinogen-III synthase [Polaromonas sp.]